jgi:hypothetical protein
VSGRVLDAAGLDATDLRANVAPANVAPENARGRVAVRRIDDALSSADIAWGLARVYPCGGSRSVRSLQEKADQACASLTRLHADAFVHPAPGRDREAS